MINLNVFAQLNADGLCINANKAAFQTQNHTDRTRPEVVRNMAKLESIAADEEDPSITYGEVFYLPCVITEAAEPGQGDAIIGGVMQADGKMAQTAMQAPAESAGEDDEPF